MSIKFQQLKQRAKTYLSNDVGIDLGTANTVIYLRGKGIVGDDPSVVALNKKTGQIVEVGAGAKRMVGRTPLHIETIKPLVGGVISDFEVAEEMIAHLLSKGQGNERKWFPPRVVVGVPSEVTNVERRAVRDAVKNAGARQVWIVEEPMAAAIGIGLPIHEPLGNMVVDIGGGTTDIAIITLGGIVASHNTKVAGDKFNQDIATYVRDEFKLLIGERTAEEIKIKGTAIMPPAEPIEIVVKGRDLVSGLPKEAIITDTDTREALMHSLDSLVHSIRQALESTPPDILADIHERGIFLVGGGALLRGLDDFLREYMQLPVHVPDSPLLAVAKGTGVILESPELYRGIVLEDDYELPLKL
jgi:rod shape-determining protein MreB